MAARRAARGDLDMAQLPRALDEPRHALALPGRDQRPDLVDTVVLLVVADRPGRRGQLGHQPVIDLGACIDPAGRRAILPGIVVAEHLQPGDRLAKVRVVEDHHRRLVGQDPRQLQRGQRRLLAGLEHHRVAAAERRGQLPGNHHQRIVPGRDRAHHAHRIAPDHAGEARHVLARRRATPSRRRPRAGTSLQADGAARRQAERGARANPMSGRSTSPTPRST